MRLELTKNIFLRIVSGIFIVSIFVATILLYPIAFNYLILLIGIGMLYEWYEITKKSSAYVMIGFVIIPPPIISLILLNSLNFDRAILLGYFVVLWSVDTLAMIGGKTLKGPKLAPIISPNKTWSGLIVGIIGAACIIFLLKNSFNYEINCYFLSNNIIILLLSALIAFIGQLSDLFISIFKRKFSIKDSGVIIPGHGGMLDRFDSIILTAPICLILFYVLCQT